MDVGFNPYIASTGVRGAVPAPRTAAPAKAAAPPPAGDAVSISSGASLPEASAPPAGESHSCACAHSTCAHLTGLGVAGALAGSPAATATAVGPISAPRPLDMTAQLKSLLPDHPFVITAERAAELMKTLNLAPDQLLQALVPVARDYAIPPISNYKVGAAGRGASGNIYLGVNLEFPGNALNQSVHGEQFVVTNALRNGEERLEALAVSAAPCGHCRQWLNETTKGSDIEILVPNQPPTPLTQLLPAAFGPGDLGVTAALLSPQNQGMRLQAGAADTDSLAEAALDAANHSYAPYSKEGAGVAVRLADGTVFTGRYSENAAFNPSLSPLQGALIAMAADGRDFKDIAEVVLAQREGSMASQEPATRTLLESVQPQAALRIAQAEPRPKA